MSVPVNLLGQFNEAAGVGLVTPSPNANKRDPDPREELEGTAKRLKFGEEKEEKTTSASDTTDPFTTPPKKGGKRRRSRRRRRSNKKRSRSRRR